MALDRERERGKAQQHWRCRRKAQEEGGREREMVSVCREREGRDATCGLLRKVERTYDE